MEIHTDEVHQERYFDFDFDRAEELRNLADLARIYIRPSAGNGEILNHLLEEYPRYHPATTLGSTISGYETGLTGLALDIANCPEIIAKTGSDLQTAILYGVNIVDNRLPDDDRYAKFIMTDMAFGLVTCRRGRLDFTPIKPIEEIDPFHHLQSMWD